MGLSASHGLLSFSYSHCKRCPAHVTVNPTAVTQRGESLARHRNCNLTQYSSHLQGALKVYICANGCCVSSLLPHSTSICLTVTSCGLLGNWSLSIECVHDCVCGFFFLYFFFILCSSGGDESQVALAIVLASNQDCGVYGCTITNEYGTDSTDFLLSIDSKKQHV